MEALSFSHLPHYHFSANRQFEPGERHINRIYELSVLLLVRKGVLRFTENGVPVEVKAGEYYIQKPNVVHTGAVASDQPNYYFIHFSGHYNKKGALPTKGTFDIESTQPFIEALDKTISADKIESEAAFFRLLIHLKNTSTKLSNAEIIRRHILQHYSEPIDLDSIGKIVFLSKNQVINTFRNEYGVTPYQFLLQFRLQKACELLLATNAPLNEVCFSTGFDEYSTFYRAFKSKYNISPAEYRLAQSINSELKDVYFDKANNSPNLPTT